MIVSQEVLAEYTGKSRPSAQARFIKSRFPNIHFIFRDDGTISMRQEEFDRYTLGKVPSGDKKTRRSLDLSLLKRAS